MSRFHSRAAYSSFERTPDAGAKPTTLSESGDRSPRGFGYLNSGTNNQAGTEELFGGSKSRDNTAATEQARRSFMDMRSSQLVMEHERGFADEQRANRGQAVLRLKGETF